MFFLKAVVGGCLRQINRRRERETERKARSTPVATVIINTSNADHPSCLGLSFLMQEPVVMF